MIPLDVVLVVATGLVIAADKTETSAATPALIVAIIAAVGALGSAYMTFRTSSKANAVNDRKVSIEDFDAQQERYRRLIADQDKVIEKIQHQMDRLSDQLTKEQDVSSALRDHIRTLQSQIDDLTRRQSEALREIASMRRTDIERNSRP